MLVNGKVKQYFLYILYFSNIFFYNFCFDFCLCTETLWDTAHVISKWAMPSPIEPRPLQVSHIISKWVKTSPNEPWHLRTSHATLNETCHLQMSHVISNCAMSSPNEPGHLEMSRVISKWTTPISKHYWCTVVNFKTGHTFLFLFSN